MIRKILLTKNNLKQILLIVTKTIKSGGVVVFPSDTVYGLLADATSGAAVKKLIGIKNRPPGKAISVFVADTEMLEREVEVGSNRAFINSILPGPYTVVLTSKRHVSKLLEAENGTLGVRFPDYLPLNELCREFGKPLTATSANLKGRGPHYTIQSMLQEMPSAKSELIDLIVDAGRLPRNKPSTIVDLSAGDLRILRRGDISFTLEKKYFTQTPAETQKLGERVAGVVIKKAKGKPVVIIIKGDLGVGKTVFSKGVAKHFGIENVVSPTYVISNEYKIPKGSPAKSYKYFVHCDFYNIHETSEFEHLGLAEYFKKGSVLCIEWGEKSGNYFEKYSNKIHVVYVEIERENEKKRILNVHL